MDPYAILGLQRNATEEDAKAAFRKLAKTCHPDLHPNDPDAERRFKEINTAYDTISKGTAGVESVQFRTGTGGFRFFDDMVSHPFEDIFQELHNRRRNQDMHLECRLTLEEVFHGKELNINLPNGRMTRTVQVKIPPGIGHGMRVGVSQCGTQTNMAQPPGDLYVTVFALPHERFVREGSNIITVVPVSAFDVLLGKTIEVINIEGKTLTVAVVAGFDSSRRLRLAGQGMPDPMMGNERGDLLIELFVQYPVLNEKQRDLIQQAQDCMVTV
jgi:curved DNA-binding protein